ncbi:MAG TPA: MMPL family transporter, partial [Candidatus Bathyarchaeia archaeon]|nr:MMPL family transporter [Candidatus Bathyarchaeia archaeon]
LDYQNNSYLRQYVSNNLITLVDEAIGLVVVALLAGYFVSRRLGQASLGPQVPAFARIARFVGRRHRIIVVFWIILLAAGLPLAINLSQVTTSNTSGGQSSTTQSAQAQAILSQEFPRPSSNTSAIILLQGADVTDNATKLFTLQLEQRFLAPGALNSVASVTSVYSLERTFLTEYFLQLGQNYTAALSNANRTVWAETLSTYPIPIPPAILGNFINPAKTAMIITVTFSQAPGSFGGANTDPILKNVVTMRNIISQLKSNDPELSQTYVTGDLATTADSSIGSNRDLTYIEPVTIGAILVLVGIFFFAIVTPIVPLATIGMALLIAEGGLYLIGKYIIPIGDTTTTFLFTIMLGVGTDYAIFLMARYREERVEGHDKETSVKTSIQWSGESISTSAVTVIIAFGAMTISSFSLLQSIGVGLGFGVLIALLVSLTLIPSLVLMAGDRVFWPTSGKRFEKYAARARKRRSDRPGYFRRAASFSVKRPVLVLVLALLVSLPAIYIALTGTTTYDFSAGLTQAESVNGIKALEQSFGAGQIGPTQVVVQFPSSIIVNGNLTSTSASSLENLARNITSLSNIHEVTGPTRPDGVAVDPTNMRKLTPEQRAGILGAIGKDNRTVVITVLFNDEPFTTNSLNTVAQIRNLMSSLQSRDSTLARDTILVGGASASTLDFSNDIVNQFNTMRVLTVVAIFVVLLVVLGSYPLALTGIASIGLSITWAYAATLLFFNDVLNAGVIFLIPLILFLLLYGIGMDYNIFILTRIREEAQKGKETHQAVVDAVDRTGGIITALAFILAGALGSLLLSSNRLLQGFGFAIGLAVILDAMVVRTYLVPAIMSLLGRRAWWGPSMLRRVKFDKDGRPISATTETKPAQEKPAQNPVDSASNDKPS